MSPVVVEEINPEIPAITTNSIRLLLFLNSEISLVTYFHHKSIAISMLKKTPTVWANKLVTPALNPRDLNPINKRVIDKKLKTVVIKNEVRCVRRLIV